MNDDFLQTDFQTPSAHFGNELLEKLQGNDQRRLSKNRKLSTFSAVPLILLIFAFSSPTVRASIEKQITRAGISFLVTSESPPSDNSTTLPNEYMTVDEARQQSDFKLPTFIPDGFNPIVARVYEEGSDGTLSEQSITAIEKGTEFVNYTRFAFGPMRSDLYTLNWQSNSEKNLGLTILTNDKRIPFLVGEETGEEVEIRDGLVGLTNDLGFWDGDDYIADERGANLHWIEGDWIYHLGSDDEEITLEVLIEIANSFD